MLPKKLPLFLLLLAFSHAAMAQRAMEGPASEREKEKARKVFEPFCRAYTAATNPENSPKTRKRALFGGLVKKLRSKNTPLFNDLNPEEGPTTYKAFTYFSEKFPELYPEGLEMEWDVENARFGKVSYAPMLDLNYLPVHLKKTVYYPQTAADTSTDSLVTTPKTYQLTLYLSFRRKNIIHPYRVLCLVKKGRPVILPEPEGLLKWWHKELDPSWKKRLRQAGKIPENPTEEKLNLYLGSIQKLDLSGQAIRSVEAVRHLNNLRKLNIRGTKVQDLSPLAGLKNLQRLNISKTRPQSFDSLAPLTQLVTLKARDAGIESLDFLKNYRRLEELDISLNTKIEDASPLKNITSLTKLNMAENVGMDIAKIARLTNLEELNIAKTDVKKLDALRNMNLVKLVANHCGITSMAPLSGMRKMYHLNLRANNISDLSPCANMPYLDYLDVAISRVVDLSPLSNADNLRKLFLHNTGVSDLGPIMGLEKISKLTIQKTEVSRGEKDRFKKKHPGCELTWY